VTQKTSQGEDLLEQLTSDSRQTRQIARRRMIAEAVMSEGSMRIEDLTDRFGISLMTAHRDVDELVSRGLFRKTRGIVTAADTVHREPPWTNWKSFVLNPLVSLCASCHTVRARSATMSPAPMPGPVRNTTFEKCIFGWSSWPALRKLSPPLAICPSIL